MPEHEFLATFDEEAFEHHAGDATLTVGEASSDLGQRLWAVVDDLCHCCHGSRQ